MGCIADANGHTESRNNASAGSSGAALYGVQAHAANRRRAYAGILGCGHACEKTHFSGVGNEGGWSLIRNFWTLANPTHWDQIASACGFLWIVPVLFFRGLPRVARRYFWILPFWLIPMFLKGGIQESRVFGELVPLVSVLAIIALESRIPVVVDPPMDVAITSHGSRLDNESRAKDKSADLDANHGAVREHSRA